MKIANDNPIVREASAAPQAPDVAVPQAPSGQAGGSPKKKPETPKDMALSILKGAAKLIMKVILIIAAFLAVFTFVFGVARIDTDYMVPAVKDGDLLLYYRLDKSFTNDDLCVLRYDNRDVCARVIGREGDIVDIDYRGLKVNGNYKQERTIYFDTTQVVDGVTFPLQVPEGCVFLLGDNRPNSIDSRIYGCVKVDELEGKVIAVFRRRNF